MKESTFFVVVGALSVISLASGLIGWRVAKSIDDKKQHGEAQTLRDLYEDNDPGEEVYPVFTDEYDDPYIPCCYDSNAFFEATHPDIFD